MSNFHKPEDQVFAIGERWYASQDYEDKCVVILSKQRHSRGKYEVNIFYQDAEDSNSQVYDKDAWNFQVRYTHSSERFKE